jgi:hypothetical protein
MHRHVLDLGQWCSSRMRAPGMPSGTTGTEDIQINWITIDNPA